MTPTAFVVRLDTIRNAIPSFNHSFISRKDRKKERQTVSCSLGASEFGKGSTLECSQSNNTRRIHAVSPSPTTTSTTTTTNMVKNSHVVDGRTNEVTVYKLHPPQLLHHEQRKNQQPNHQKGEGHSHIHHTITFSQSLLLDSSHVERRESAHRKRNGKRSRRLRSRSPTEKTSKNTTKNKHISQLIR